MYIKVLSINEQQVYVRMHQLRFMVSHFFLNMRSNRMFHPYLKHHELLDCPDATPKMQSSMNFSCMDNSFPGFPYHFLAKFLKTFSAFGCPIIGEDDNDDHDLAAIL